LDNSQKHNLVVLGTETHSNDTSGDADRRN